MSKREMELLRKCRAYFVNQTVYKTGSGKYVVKDTVDWDTGEEDNHVFETIEQLCEFCEVEIDG